jgi:hypothetical protein
VSLNLQNVFPSATSQMRHVVYACYQPASLASPADLEEKQAGYRDFMLTTHWPAMNIKKYDTKNAIGKSLPTLVSVGRASSLLRPT